MYLEPDYDLAVRITGDTSQMSIAWGFLIAAAGVAVFAIRLARRRQYRKSQWSDFTNGCIFTLVPVAGIFAFGLYLLVLLIYLGGLLLAHLSGR